MVSSKLDILDSQLKPVNAGLMLAKVLGAIWFCLIVFITAATYAPSFLNADVLLNSVMSLQNVTLYYWGQNRLLNVLPLIASVVHDPVFNLGFVIAITVAVFYLFLLVLARCASDYLQEPPSRALQVFIMLSSSFLLIFQPIAVAEIAIGHIEYSFSALLVALALWLLWRHSETAWTLETVVCCLIFFSIGVNPSAFLLLAFALAARVVQQKAIRSQDIRAALFSVAALVFWLVIARNHGSTEYSAFSIQLIPTGLANILPSLMGLFDRADAQLFGGFLLMGLIFVWFSGGQSTKSLRNVCLGIGAGFVVFSLLWLVLFSSHTWVAANNFHWRYFIFILFGLYVFLAVLMTSIFSCMGGITRWVLVAVIAALGVFKGYQAPVPFSDFQVFRAVQNFAPKPYGLYSGNYWGVWPAVWRDLSLGEAAFGLAYRGDGNLAAARAHIYQQLEANGDFFVLCIKDDIGTCMGQIEQFSGPIICMDATRKAEDVLLLRLVPRMVEASADTVSAPEFECGLP